MKITYLTYGDLAADVQELVRKIPYEVRRDLIGVVGVPRSGMIPATMVANQLHLPLADCSSFSHLRRFYQGSRVTSVPSGNTVLVVDDSAYAGNAMNAVRDSLIPFSQDCTRFLFTAVYRCPERRPELDYYAREVAVPRYFEWNLVQHPNVSRFMMDLDGILCYDPPMFDNDDDEYRSWLESAEPLYLPRHTIHTICTMRLEKYRAPTEDWLDRHGVRYQHLVMCPCETAQERRKGGRYSTWKALQYQGSGTDLFIESSQQQAREIWEQSGRPTLCPHTQEVFQ